MFLPKLSGTMVITVWQPFLGVVESFRLPWSFRNQIGSILHHYLFNSWPLIPLFWLGAGYFDRIVVHTVHQKAQLFFIPKRKIRLIENGVPAPRKTTRRERSNPPGVLYVGHATAVKGLDVLLSALGQARNRVQFRVTLALTEFQNIDVERLVALNGLKDIVTIKGHVNVLDELLRHDVLVIPHKASVGTSCYPNIALEAFSVGVPIIASATDVLREIIDDQITGFLVPPGDAIRLEQALVKLFNAPQDTEKMAESQQDVFNRRFFIDRYVERHLQIYEELSSARLPTDRADDSGRHS
jgi:glycosyltransferase involved in cell wall biosynthesis